MILVIIVIIIALVFEYINGFHDTAISIATSVSTKVLTPRQAVVLAATCNLVGALVGVSVATTIGKGLVDTDFVTMRTIVCALVSAIIWNIFTWWLGLPSSSSHALIGGLCGAALATAKGNWNVIRWSVANPDTGKLEGLWHKVIALAQGYCPNVHFTHSRDYYGIVYYGTAYVLSSENYATFH